MRNTALISFLLLLIEFGCQKPASNTGDNRPSSNDSTTNSGDNSGAADTAKDSTFVIIKAEGSGGTIVRFNYDKVNKRYTEWSFGYSTRGLYDSTFAYYDKNGRPDRLVRKTWDGAPRVYVQFYHYNNKGLLTRITHKYRLERFATNDDPYLTQLNNPYDDQVVDTNDSLVSNSKNNITEDYTINVSSNTISSYKILSYQASNDSLLSRVVTYSLSAGSYKVSSDLRFGPYYKEVNPYYNKFHSLAIFSSSSTFLPMVPSYYFHDGNAVYLSISPYLCGSFNGVNHQINYDFNSDSLPVLAYAGGDRLTEYIKFYYQRVKK